MSFQIPEDELRFRAVRASGPGGQHVNKTSTKIDLSWDVGHSGSLSDAEKRRVIEKLANRIDAQGVLHVTSGGRRSQLQNREAAIRRADELVTKALHVPKPRKPTRPPKKAKEDRLAAKKKRSALKEQRKRPDPSE
ncbi:MAG: alternative ribosome rescue aminoacyl-tRNA hydrolase ArfB [Gemmatimonadetes bacterium]|nr:alternative ribosome rescue aminoacyl-tRNA hydrolase ArfB [Gemmatimonadota bacterium]